MQDGNDNIIESAERAIRQMAGCGLSHSAKDVKRLIVYTKALDKNQKGLIKTLLRYQRANKSLWKITNRMYIMMNQGQKNIVDTWLKEKDP